MRGALVGIKQDFPVVPLGAQYRLALINSVFVARFVDVAIAVTVSGPGRRDITLRFARDHFRQQFILQRLLRSHDLSAIVIFLVKVVENLRLRARIVPQPVVIIDARVTVSGERFWNTSGFWQHISVSFMFYTL
ncbi:hypothetical protein D3C80_1053520 [compost metagenome]